MKLCAFRCLISRPQNSKSEVLKSNSWKITSFLKTMALQRELFSNYQLVQAQNHVGNFVISHNLKIR